MKIKDVIAIIDKMKVKVGTDGVGTDGKRRIMYPTWQDIDYEDGVDLFIFDLKKKLNDELEKEGESHG